MHAFKNLDQFLLPSVSLCSIVDLDFKKTRPDTRLPKSRAGGQGPYLRSLHHLGRSSEAKDRKKTKKVKCDGPTEGPTDRQIGLKSRVARD